MVCWRLRPSVVDPWLFIQKLHLDNNLGIKYSVMFLWIGNLMENTKQLRVKKGSFKGFNRPKSLMLLTESLMKLFRRVILLWCYTRFYNAKLGWLVFSRSAIEIFIYCNVKMFVVGTTLYHLLVFTWFMDDPLVLNETSNELDWLWRRISLPCA